jgi:putative DNA primase/helicase
MTDVAEIAAALKARRAGRHQWLARCPAHDDRNPSLSISVSRDGRTLVHCHAGCAQDQVIAALKDRGLWNSPDDHPRIQIVTKPVDHDDDKARTQAAMSIWNSTIPARNTLVDVYLRSRGITLPIPASLRFHSALKHTPTGTIWPAMVAIISGADGAPVAVHRTYLARDGKGKAHIKPNKMTLGPCRGGAVRLGELQAPGSLAITEGIETGLSVMQATGLPVWASLSADGMKAVKLPPEATTVTLCADNDANGVGKAAAECARKRFLREGRPARITMPPEVGTDFNDLLCKSKEKENVH